MDVPEDFVDLIDLGVAWEKRALLDHFCEDTADGPHIDGRRVMTRSEQDFRRSIP